MNELSKYRFKCNLSLGDIYGQVIVWLAVVFASLAAALSLMSHPMYALAVVGLIIVVSFPFLLFAFVSTLFNNIEVEPIEETQRLSTSAPKTVSVKNAVA